MTNREKAEAWIEARRPGISQQAWLRNFADHLDAEAAREKADAKPDEPVPWSVATLDVTTTNRGLGVVNFPKYPSGEPRRLIQESSMVGNYVDALDEPGSWALWIGEHHHLNREQVGELIGLLIRWLGHGTFRPVVQGKAVGP